jgi:hypothetical protein
MSLIRSIVFAAGIGLASQPALAADFRLESWFEGRTVARGEFSTITGYKRGFDVVLTGTWNGRTLTLREDFVFDDGEKDRKTWRFTKTGPGTYSGTREDVIGSTAVRVEGNTARFSYDVYLDGKNQKNRVRFDDVMELRSDGTVLNVARVSKFGLPVGRTKVEFRRP